LDPGKFLMALTNSLLRVGQVFMGMGCAPKFNCKKTDWMPEQIRVGNMVLYWPRQCAQMYRQAVSILDRGTRTKAKIQSCMPASWVLKEEIWLLTSGVSCKCFNKIT
jgi:hypothetical protein